MHALRSAAKNYVPDPVVQFVRKTRTWWRSPHWHEQHEYADRFDFLRKAFITLKYNGIAGDYAEFGSCGANTLCMAHRILADYSYDVGPFHLWAFDSFQGLPAASEDKDAHPRWIEGEMATPLEEFHRLCSARGVPRSAYTTVPGYYEESLDPSAEGPRPENIRLAYIDCDMYSSTRTVLQFLRPKLQHGMILAFDDYYCYSSTDPSGERLAALEEFAHSPQWRLLPYNPFGWHGMSFIVESAAASSGNETAVEHW